jgi:hypothetical protein
MTEKLKCILKKGYVGECQPDKEGIYKDYPECHDNCQTEDEWDEIQQEGKRIFYCDKTKPSGYKCMLIPEGEEKEFKEDVNKRGPFQTRDGCRRTCDQIVIPELRDVNVIVNDEMIEQAKNIMMKYNPTQYIDFYRACGPRGFEFLIERLPNVRFITRLIFRDDGYLMNPKEYYELIYDYITFKVAVVVDKVREWGIDKIEYNVYLPYVSSLKNRDVNSVIWVEVIRIARELRKTEVPVKEESKENYYLHELYYRVLQLPISEGYLHTDIKPQYKKNEKNMKKIRKLIFSDMIELKEVEEIVDKFLMENEIISFLTDKNCLIIQWLSDTYLHYLRKAVEDTLFLGKAVFIYVSVKGEDWGHANNLIIRNTGTIKEIIKIEPHGERKTFYPHRIENAIKKLFNYLIDTGYQYVDDFLASIGIQRYENVFQYCEKPVLSVTGLCQTWALYVTLILLFNIKTPRQDFKTYLSFKYLSPKNAIEVAQNKAVATFLLLSWGLTTNMQQLKTYLPSYATCHAGSIIDFRVQYKVYNALEPLYRTIDKRLKTIQLGGANYYQKYLKYKQKYLALKVKMGV